MKIFLFDTETIHANLLPLSFTRPVADFRCGIVTIREKWELELKSPCRFLPVEYLRDKFGGVEDESETSLFIIGNLLPDCRLVEKIKLLQVGFAITKNGEPLVFKGSWVDFVQQKWCPEEWVEELASIEYVFDLFLKNFDEIRVDFKRLTNGRESQPIPKCVKVTYSDNEKANSGLFVEEGASVECVSINLKDGPVYIGRDSVIMEGSCVRGPLAVCEGSELRMGAKVYGGTTIGPHCKVGGEIDNVVMFGYSNKAHEGYLGNAVIGEWCNIGAGVNASNLKNDYSMIRVWNYKSHTFMHTDLQFCGLIMGDHSKIGVNCMINTATVIGVGVNIHGSGFPRTYLPNFCEGSPNTGFSKTPFKKFSEVADRVMSRRKVYPDDRYKAIYERIYNDSEGCE